MLKRIANANEEIVEILLSKNKVLSALRYLNKNCFPISQCTIIGSVYRFARDTIPVESISARKFLEAAQNSQDPSVFYGVYKYFQQRNRRARGSVSFLKGNYQHGYLSRFRLIFDFLSSGEHCEVYTRHFSLLYGDGDSCTSLSDSLSS